MRNKILKTNYLFIYIVIAVVMAMMTITVSSCKKNQEAGSEAQKIEDDKEAKYWKLISESWEAKDEHLLPVIDSLEAIGEMTPARADFARGVTYDRARHVKAGERFYAKVYETTDPKKEGWDFYLEVANRLSQIRMTMNDSKGSIAVATDILERAEKAGKLNDGLKASYLWSIALCQTELGLPEAEQTHQQVYELLQKQAKDQDRKASGNLLVYTYIIAETKMGQGKYTEAETWLKKADDMLKQFTQPGDSAIVREYTSLLAMSRVHLLEGLNREELAYAYFRKSLPLILISPECVSQAASYLLEKKKYNEAADLYNHIDATTPDDNRESEMNLENIGSNIIPRLQANLGAGRTDSVISIARRIAENYIKALEKDREDNAAELATIYNTQGKEKQIAEQKASMSRQRSIALMGILVLMIIFMIIYTWYRRRAENRLGTALVQVQNANHNLQQAYDQLEETTKAKERIESELRIARDIQMSMVPDVFPEHESLDMYAEMKPAKEVGGDLYGYVFHDQSLYFCVGDVSGKGVPASLFMAQTTRLFRTLAAQGMKPAEICTRMNTALTDGNTKRMFVTFFLGLMDLNTGHLEFCNCGHNAPVIGDGNGQADFVKVIPNMPIGIIPKFIFKGEQMDNMKGKSLFIFSDGLNEAENQEKEQFGNHQMLDILRRNSSESSRQVIETMTAEVERHRHGAEPNDDLTMMAIHLK